MSDRTSEKLETKARELAGQELTGRMPDDFVEWQRLIEYRLLDQLPAGVAILNEDLVLTGQNQTYASYLDRYSPIPSLRALGQCYFDYLPGSYDYVGEVFRTAQSTITPQTTYNHELRVKAESGPVVTYWDATLQPLKDRNGRLKGMGVFCLDITARTQMAKSMGVLETAVDRISEKLHEARSAVGYMARMKDRERFRLEELLTFNANEALLPLLDRLKQTHLTKEQQNVVWLLETALGDIVSDYSFRLSSPALGLTAKEVLVARMIRDGQTTRQMADRLDVAASTIDFHRHNIRRKLGLTNKRANLQTFLKSLPQGSKGGD